MLKAQATNQARKVMKTPKHFKLMLKFHLEVQQIKVLKDLAQHKNQALNQR